jgi:Uncharacterized protein conserved in bacteria C-term(DUF2220)
MEMEKREIEFAAALKQAADGRVTIDLATIWQCFHATRPELKNEVTSRQRLAADLRALSESEVISLPASKSSFDRTALPVLPRFIRLLEKPVVPEAQFDHRTFPWSLPMSFVAGLARLPNPRIAQRLNDFFRGNWSSRIPVPIKERSYEIFGNEKMLERVLDGQLGYEGRLTMETLRCYCVPLVPVHRVFARGVNVIIIENEATFDSVSRWNIEHGAFRMVIYGRGREAEKMADFLFNEVQTNSGIIYYFGDIDRLGICIPYRLSRMLERKGGCGISPAASCYRLLLQQSPAAITMVDVEDEVDDPPDSEWIAALDWLPVDTRTQTKVLLEADRRVAQEATGWELLRNEGSLV